MINGTDLERSPLIAFEQSKQFRTVQNSSEQFRTVQCESVRVEKCESGKLEECERLSLRV